jgi:acyl CoA:acetate/3-ketoacid CoA transferase beta subunit
MMDRDGNLNTTVSGPWEAPEVRLPGSGGGNDVGSLAQRTIIILRQDTRRLVERVNFMTTPGYIDGPGARERAGLPAGTGPYRVLTQLAVYDFDEDTKQLRLRATHPGVSVADVQAASGFKIQVADSLEVTSPPTEEERRLLHEIDPAGMVIGK